MHEQTLPRLPRHTRPCHSCRNTAPWLQLSWSVKQSFSLFQRRKQRHADTKAIVSLDGAACRRTTLSYIVYKMNIIGTDWQSVYFCFRKKYRRFSRPGIFSFFLNSVLCVTIDWRAFNTRHLFFTDNEKWWTWGSCKKTDYLVETAVSEVWDRKQLLHTVA